MKGVSCIQRGPQAYSRFSVFNKALFSELHYYILRYIKGKQTSTMCIHCGKQEVEGCHVHPFMKNEDIYIVPMCHKCNTSEVCVTIDSDWAEPLSEVSKAYTPTPNLGKIARRIFNNN